MKFIRFCKPYKVLVRLRKDKRNIELLYYAIDYYIANMVKAARYNIISCGFYYSSSVQVLFLYKLRQKTVVKQKTLKSPIFAP